jgi:hypothetical protein
MNLNPENNPLLSPYGAPIGLISGQEERVEELNMRMMERKFPDVDFKPNFSPRPVMTKYTMLQMIDPQQKPTVPIQPYLDYFPEVMFHPGNDRAPISGYFNRINVENELRCQTRPLVHCDEISKQYIPSLKSDLYKVEVKSNKHVEQTHPLLFTPFKLESSATNLEGKPVGNALFNNHTRTQIRCMS